MTDRRRRRPAGLAVLAAAIAASLSLPAAAQAPPTPPTIPVGPGLAVPEGAEVHSWALAPTGSADPSQPGNRANLSYHAAPGTAIEDSVTVFNLGTVPLTFRLYATDAFNNQDGQFDVLPGDKDPTDVGRWVSLPQANLTVLPGDQASMPVTIVVPADATPGDHVGAVLASSQVGGRGHDGKVVTLDRRTGTRLYVRVAGPVTPHLAVENVSSVYRPSLSPFSGTLEVRYRVQNRGNVRLGGTARVEVAGPLGLGGRAGQPATLPELLPGEGVVRSVTLQGVPAPVILSTAVEVEPATVVAGDPATVVEGVRLRTVAPPVTLVALVLVAALLHRARRAWLRHRVGGPAMGAPAA